METRHMNRKSTVETLARNLEHLMDISGMNKPALSRKSGVSERMIAYILKGEKTSTIETAQRLAEVFGLEGWHLIMPNLPHDLEHSKRFNKLVQRYLNSSEDGKTMIDMVAERESKYTINQ